MLISLAIRDIILIERLELEFERGLCALTGRDRRGQVDPAGRARPGARRARGACAGASWRGAGLGERGVRRAGRATATWPPGSTATASRSRTRSLLRRVIGADGRSRAFVNDQPVSTGLLRELAALLVEVHGQHEQQALLDPGVQRRLLDEYGRLDDALERGASRLRGLARMPSGSGPISKPRSRARRPTKPIWRHALDRARPAGARARRGAARSPKRASG